MPIKKLFKTLKSSVAVSQPNRSSQNQTMAYREVLQREAQIGGQLFGPIPHGHRREFFCLDESTWIWHEEWTDATNKQTSRTTRYDVRPQGILKAQDGSAYQQVAQPEAENLLAAAKLYWQRVKNEVYAPIL